MKVLVADDEALSCRKLERLLETWGYEVVVAHDGVEALKLLLAPDPPVLAVLDWMMPGLTGPEVIREVRRNVQEPYIFTILLTARSQRADLILGLDSGADDYVAKPFDAQELEVRLRGGRRIIELQSALIVAREALRVQATRDALTGLYNRRALFEQFGTAFDACLRDGRDLAVFMVDLDRFKLVNDRHGHAGGDSVLAEAANRMRADLRSYDMLGRVGGEEFVAVLPGIDTTDMLYAAERMRLAVGRTPIRHGDTQIAVTCSIGVAALSRCRPRSTAQLMHDADTALYTSKATGRNRVTLAWVPIVADDTELSLTATPPLFQESTYGDIRDP